MNETSRLEPLVQNLSAFRLPPNFRGRPGWFVQLWWIVEATLFRWSPQPLYGWRRFLLRLFGAKIGNGVLIRPTVHITYPWKLSIGNNSWIGDYTTLYTLGPITIGHDACVSQHSYICAASHDYTKSAFDIFEKGVTIEPEAWIATGVFVSPGVTIGRGSVVGARSLVTRDTAPMTIYVGSPAKASGPRLKAREKNI